MSEDQFEYDENNLLRKDIKKYTSRFLAKNTSMIF